jgi:DNA (cytosine-5)-methyltransferase 1
MKKNVASLFSGCGGMDLGFEGNFSIHTSSLSSEELAKPEYVKGPNGFVTVKPLPFETVFACDVNSKAKLAWDEYFSKRRHIGGAYQLESIVDIVKKFKSGEASIPKNIDVVTGGFPCNDFSVAGKRLGFNSNKSHAGNSKVLDGQEDPTAENRGMLYFWMREFISLVQPYVFYAENVKGLVSLGDAKEVISKDFESINGSGYFVLPVRVLKAIDYGVPQTRERVIFIGLNKNRMKKEVLDYLNEHETLPPDLDFYPKASHGSDDLFSETLRQYSTTGDVFSGLVEPELSHDPSQRAYSKAKYLVKGQGSSEILLGKPGPTIRAEHHGNIEYRRRSAANGGKNLSELSAGLEQRRLSVRECSRLQTFPDDFEFVLDGKLSASDGYRLIGNAVPPLLAYRLAQRLESIWDNVFVPRNED